MPWNLEIWLFLDVTRLTRLRLRYFLSFWSDDGVSCSSDLYVYIYDMWSLAGMMEQILSSLSYMEKNQGVKVLR